MNTPSASAAFRAARPDHLRLGLFSANCQGGLAIGTAPGGCTCTVTCFNFPAEMPYFCGEALLAGKEEVVSANDDDILFDGAAGAPATAASLGDARHVRRLQADSGMRQGSAIATRRAARMLTLFLVIRDT